jgi:hypothetical protein
MSLALVWSLALLLPQSSNGELPPLTAGEAAALEVIDERTVRATMAFLSSDELAGRDTPSPGLHVATAYVAARFAGAGLEGIGAGGSYYLDAEVETSALPEAGLEAAGQGGEPLRVLGLLQAARETALELLGPLLDAGRGLPEGGVSPFPDGPIDGAVIVDQAEAERVRPGWPASAALLGPLRRQAEEASRRGARALLVRVPADSPLIETARDLHGKAVLRDPMGFARLPIVLVPAGTVASELRLRVPPRVRARSPVRNVCGVLRGSDNDRSAQAVVVSAHLDHVGTAASGADRIFNGADDDASGVCGMLALADAFAALAERPARTLLFVAFFGEERGMLGSRDFCDDPPWPLENMVADVNLEMLGRPEEGARHKAWMTGWDRSNLGELMARGAKRVGVEIFCHPQHSAMLYGASDNISFVRRGVIGHSFSAGSLHQDYHQVTDEWQKLDLAHMTVVIRGLFAGVLPLAQGVYTPTS